jgi:hypothetical protein
MFKKIPGKLLLYEETRGQQFHERLYYTIIPHFILVPQNQKPVSPPWTKVIDLCKSLV